MVTTSNRDKILTHFGCIQGIQGRNLIYANTALEKSILQK